MTPALLLLAVWAAAPTPGAAAPTPGAAAPTRGAAAAAPEVEARCRVESFPAVAPSRSAERRDAIEACTEWALDGRGGPLPYYFRGGARWVGPDPMRGWNEPPYFDLSVAEDAGRVLFDYEHALGRSSGERPLPDEGLAWLRVGYLYASSGKWPESIRAFRRAEAFPGTAPEARQRLPFVEGRLIAPDRLLGQPPRRCGELDFWDCAFVDGCSLIMTEDHAFRACRGKPRGLEPGVRSKGFDCALLDKDFCDQTPRCRWTKTCLSVTH